MCDVNRNVLKIERCPPFSPLLKSCYYSLELLLWQQNIGLENGDDHVSTLLAIKLVLMLN